MKTMNDRQVIIAYARQLGLEVIPPSKDSPGILITDYSVRPARHVVDARTWKEARAQLVSYANARFN